MKKVFLVSTFMLISCLQAGEPFTCNSNSYLFTSDQTASETGVFNIGMNNARVDFIKTFGDSHINATGYNVKDNYIYGWEYGEGDNYSTYDPHLVKIDANFNVERVNLIGTLPKTRFYLGDIDKNGIFYLANRHQPDQYANVLQEIQRVDLNTHIVLPKLTLDYTDATEIKASDFAINPMDNQLYTVNANNNQLVRINTSTGKVEELGNVGNIGNTYSVINFFDKYGNFYFYINDSEKIYKINISNPDYVNPEAKPFTASLTGMVNSGDGARCVNAALDDTDEASIAVDVVKDFENNGYIPDSTITVSDQPFTLDAVLLDGNSNPVAYHPAQSSNPIPMSVLFYTRKTGSNEEAKRLDGVLGRFYGGDKFTTSSEISPNIIDEGEHEVKVKYLNFYDREKVNLIHCSGSGLNSTLKGLPACINGESHYRDMFGDAATEACFSKGNHGGQADLPCSSGYGSDDVEERYNHPYGCYECTIDALWGSDPKDTTAKVIKDPVPFTCESESFISWNDAGWAGEGESHFDTVLLKDGSLKASENAAGVNGVNSMGYNIKDNMIWGWNIGAQKVVRIDANKNATLYDIGGLPERFYVAADVSKDGVLCLFSRESSEEVRKIERVDLNTMQYLSPISLDSSINTADFAFNPVDNRLYFVQKDTDDLYAITFSSDNMTQNSVTGHVAKVADLGLSGVDPIINFFDKEGNFYFNTDTENMYRFNVKNDTAASWFSKLDRSLRNGDGARCPLAEVAPSGAKLSVSGATVVEGNSGQTILTFTVTLDKPADQAVTFQYETVDGTAKQSDSDYIPVVDSATIPAGDTTMRISVPVVGDLKEESDEYFMFRVTGAEHATVAVSEARGTIQNDDSTRFNAWDVDLTPDNPLIRTKVTGGAIRLRIGATDSSGNLTTADGVRNIEAVLVAGTTELTERADVTLSANGTADVDFRPLLKNAFLHSAFADVAVKIFYTDAAGETQSVISSDHFAIRPDHYELQIDPEEVAAGDEIPMALRAVDIGGNIVENYSVEATKYEIAQRQDFNATTTCRTDLTASLQKSNFSAGEANAVARYEDVARELTFTVREKQGMEFAIIDSNDGSQYRIRPDSDSLKVYAGRFDFVADLRNGDETNGYTYYNSYDPSNPEASKMAAQFNIGIEAKSSSGTILNNFSGGCFAENIYLDIAYTISSDESGATYHMHSAYFDYNDERKSAVTALTDSSASLTAGSGTFSNYRIEKSLFVNGIGIKKAKFNFARDENRPRLPMKMTFGNINMHTASGSSVQHALNRSVTFLYARAYVPDKKIVGEEGDVRLFYEVFCDGCNKAAYGLHNLKESVDFSRWLRLPVVNEEYADFSIRPEDNGLSASGAPISATAGAQLQRVVHVDNRTIGLSVSKTPMTVSIRYRPRNYLRYGAFSDAQGRQRFNATFVKANDKWGGRGKVGHTVDTGISARGTENKLDW